MLQALFKGIGGLASDAVEGIKTVGEEIANIPDALSEGFEQGLMVDTEQSIKDKAINEAKAEVEKLDGNDSVDTEIVTTTPDKETP